MLFLLLTLWNLLPKNITLSNTAFHILLRVYAPKTTNAMSLPGDEMMALYTNKS